MKTELLDVTTFCAMLLFLNSNNLKIHSLKFFWRHILVFKYIYKKKTLIFHVYLSNFKNSISDGIWFSKSWTISFPVIKSLICLTKPNQKKVQIYIFQYNHFLVQCYFIFRTETYNKQHKQLHSCDSRTFGRSRISAYMAW